MADGKWQMAKRQMAGKWADGKFCRHSNRPVVSKLPKKKPASPVTPSEEEKGVLGGVDLSIFGGSARVVVHNHKYAGL